MAGHSQFANIKHRKGVQDARKAKIFTKILREITVAAKNGQPDPNFNPRLRNAIIEARNNNMPKDKVEAAIKKVVSGNDNSNFEEIRYEGYAVGGVAVIVEALTDNRNRTASEVRSIFTKNGGNLGETGSVAFMFEKIGYIEFANNILKQNNCNIANLLDKAIDLAVNDIIEQEEATIIITSPEDFITIRDQLTAEFANPISAKLCWQAKNHSEVNCEQAKTIIKMLDSLEECDDVQNVVANYTLNPAELAKLNCQIG